MTCLSPMASRRHPAFFRMLTSSASLAHSSAMTATCHFDGNTMDEPGFLQTAPGIRQVALNLVQLNRSDTGLARLESLSEPGAFSGSR